MVSTPADARLRLRISAVSGRVAVTAEHRKDLVVERGGSIQESRDGAVEVRGHPSDPVEVRCPVGTDVVVGTRSGHVELRGSFGTVGVTSQSGTIRVGAAVDADLRTVSGNVELETCDGRCRVSTTSGRVVVGATHDAELSTTSGTVGVDEATGAVRVRSVSGTVTVASSASGPVQVSTVSGSITIRLPPGVRPTVRSSGRGKVRSTFEAGDDVLVDIASVSGTVQLLPA